MRELLWICFLASFTFGTAWGHGTSTSPQGAVGISSGSAVCGSSSSGLKSSIPTCTDSASNSLWFTVRNASVSGSVAVRVPMRCTEAGGLFCFV